MRSGAFHLQKQFRWIDVTVWHCQSRFGKLLTLSCFQAGTCTFRWRAVKEAPPGSSQGAGRPACRLPPRLCPTPFTFCRHQANKGVRQHLLLLTSWTFIWFYEREYGSEALCVQWVDLATFIAHGRRPRAGRRGKWELLHEEALC